MPWNNTNQMSLKLLVGYCDQLQPYTKFVGTCADSSVTSQNLNYWFSTNKMFSKYINFDTFPKTGEFEYQTYNDFTSFS